MNNIFPSNLQMRKPRQESLNLAQDMPLAGGNEEPHGAQLWRWQEERVAQRAGGGRTDLLTSTLADAQVRPSSLIGCGQSGELCTPVPKRALSVAGPVLFSTQHVLALSLAKVRASASWEEMPSPPATLAGVVLALA